MPGFLFVLNKGARGFKANFMPGNPDILWLGKPLDHAREQVIEFTVPTRPGDCPYICTFISYHVVRRRMLHVK